MKIHGPEQRRYRHMQSWLESAFDASPSQELGVGCQATMDLRSKVASGGHLNVLSGVWSFLTCQQLVCKDSLELRRNVLTAFLRRTKITPNSIFAPVVQGMTSHQDQTVSKRKTVDLVAFSKTLIIKEALTPRWYSHTFIFV